MHRGNAKLGHSTGRCVSFEPSSRGLGKKPTELDVWPQRSFAAKGQVLRTQTGGGHISRGTSVEAGGVSVGGLSHLWVGGGFDFGPRLADVWGGGICGGCELPE